MNKNFFLFFFSFLTILSQTAICSDNFDVSKICHKPLVQIQVFFNNEDVRLYSWGGHLCFHEMISNKRIENFIFNNKKDCQLTFEAGDNQEDIQFHFNIIDQTSHATYYGDLDRIPLYNAVKSTLKTIKMDVSLKQQENECRKRINIELFSIYEEKLISNKNCMVELTCHEDWSYLEPIIDLTEDSLQLY